MKVLKHNINDYVFVKLTPEGEKIYEDYWHQYDDIFTNMGYPTPPIKKDKDGYTKFQNWNFMQIFGSSFRIGMGGPIETQIKIEVEDENLEV
jgi:hypothetical protein